MANKDSTVIVDQYRRFATASAGANSYRDLRIHALPGLHEFLGSLIENYIRSGATVLDVAAGSGAVSLRLRDLGYIVRASDYVAENFKPNDIPSVRANLNEKFSELFLSASFHAVIASEIIEHLENPRHFFRQCYELLEEGGYVVLSTPNIHNSGSLASFVRTGHLLWFDDEDSHVQGHTTPITQWQIARCMSEAGFVNVWAGSFRVGATRIEVRRD